MLFSARRWAAAGMWPREPRRAGWSAWRACSTTAHFTPASGMSWSSRPTSGAGSAPSSSLELW